MRVMRTKSKPVRRKRARKVAYTTVFPVKKVLATNVERLVTDLKKAKLSVALHQEIKVIMRTLKRNERALKRYL